MRGSLRRTQPPRRLLPRTSRPPAPLDPWGAHIAADGCGAAARSCCTECKPAMAIPAYALWMLEQESRALLTRLARVKPFVLQESMLPAAGLLPASQVAIERFLIAGRRHLRALVNQFLTWLRSPQSAMS